jgi:hypothetical protein
MSFILTNTDTMRNNGSTPLLKFIVMNLVALLLGSCTIAQAQGGMSYLPVPDLSNAAYTLAVHEVNFEGVSHLGKQKLSYDQVKGSPFFYEEFHQAEIFMIDGRSMGKYMVKFNLLTHEFHFLGKNNAEMVVPNDIVSKIVVYDKTDSAVQKAVFVRTLDFKTSGGNPLGEYAEQLNDGKAILYKVTRKNVVTTDSLFGTLKRYYFGTTYAYFIGINGRVNQLKKLSEDAVFTALPTVGKLEDWARKNKINLKREEGVLALMQQWNASFNNKR